MKLESVAERIGYLFNTPGLLRQALTHRSFNINHNERLEFLGDSVLNCAIAQMIFRSFPQLPEGDLSRIRSALVRESTLADIAMQLNLGDALQLGDGELQSGGSRRASTLADAMEALIGAVFVDGGFYSATQVVEMLYQPLLENIDPKNIGKDPKTLLQEYLQAKKMALPEYALVDTKGEAHAQTFYVECRLPALKIHAVGNGHSRRNAEQQAAEAAYLKATNRG